MRVILFDWDGTIVDSVPALYETDAAVCREMGVPFDAEIFRRAFSPNWRLMYRTLGIPDDRIGEATAIWAGHFRNDLTRPFEGVQAALADLAAAGNRVGLVTGGDRKFVEPNLSRVGIDRLMSVRVFGDDTETKKPDPGPLLLALDRAGARPTDTIYVGDALDDMRMAAQVGAWGVGIESMLATPEELLEAGASETAPSVAEWAGRFLARASGRPAR
jgi:HAD superfamily hydrolase (TIGR01509 family)